MAFIGPALMSALLGMITKIVTAEGVEFIVRWGARWLAASTKTTHDDEFVAGVEKLLDGHNPNG